MYAKREHVGIEGALYGFITAVHLTDTHCDYDNVDKLRQWVKNSGEQIDLVLISGDITNIPLDKYHTASAELNKEHEEHMKIITESFLGISEKVYYIPGNVS